MNRMDIIPEYLAGRKEYTDELNVGDRVEVTQIKGYRYAYDELISYKGTVIRIDPEDTWGYLVRFDEGPEDWFMRYHLFHLTKEVA